MLFALAVHVGERTERRLLRLRTTKVTPVLTGHMDDGRVVRVREHSTVSVDVTGGRDGNRQFTIRTTLSTTPLEVELAQFSAGGELVRSSTATLYEELLAHGLQGFGRGDEDPVGCAHAYLLLDSLQQLGTADPVLAEQLFAIADRPSLWSVVTSLGVTIELRGGELGPWRGATDDSTARVLPLDVHINGAPSLWADLLCGGSKPPFALCAGVLGAVARHATDPQRYCVLRLLAARRGQAPEAPVAPAAVTK